MAVISYFHNSFGGFTLYFPTLFYFFISNGLYHDFHENFENELTGFHLFC